MKQQVTASQSQTASDMLEEFEHELGKTRRFLERLPDARLSWQPHEKSLTAGQLAMHIAETAGGIARYVCGPGGAPPGGEFRQPASSREVLDELESGAEHVRRMLGETDDTWMEAIFTIDAPSGDRILVSRKRFLRAVLFNHVYHHRGQFGVYLRLLGLSVPSAYGPSGDEMGGL